MTSLLLLWGCETSTPMTDAGSDPLADSDGDGIPDDVEDRRGMRDSDGDGTPDYLDLDSDADGIEDFVEAGDTDLETAPVDTDLDGVPDYLDLDSDDNALPDEIEGVVDHDLDGVPGYADVDDDEDGIPDAAEIAMILPPMDTDGDGQPNYRDIDSDDDWILDTDEFGPDVDQDGLFDHEDLDTDGDGLSDRWESGDDDLFSRPIDSDGDAIPDFRDLDSDGDFLSDADELELGTDPRREDTDGDGVSDYLERVSGTDALDPDESPLSRGDFVFTVPYEAPPMPPRDTIEFRTDVQFADVYFLFDISGSMRPILDGVRAVASDVLTELTCEDFGVTCSNDAECGPSRVCSVEGRCVSDPALTGCIPSLHSGTGVFSNSCTGCHRYRNDLSIQADPVMTRNRMPTNIMGGAEDHFRTLSCLADPANCDGEAMCATTGVGCAGFRPSAIRMVIMFSDEDDECQAGQCVGLDTAAIAGSFLRTSDIFFVGVNSAPPGAEHDATTAQFEDIARASNSLTQSGQPIVFDAAGADPMALGRTVANAVRQVTQGVPRRVVAEARDVDSSDPDATRFIDYLEINAAGTLECADVSPREDADGDGHDETFPQLVPGSRVCWDVVVRPNDWLMPTEDPQILEAQLVVRTDDSVLDTRNVWFLVPSSRETMIPD